MFKNKALFIPIFFSLILVGLSVGMVLYLFRFDLFIIQIILFSAVAELIIIFLIAVIYTLVISYKKKK